MKVSKVKNFFVGYRLSFLALVAAVVVFMILLLFTKNVLMAQFGGFGLLQPFGGELTNVDYTSCTCSGLVLTIQQPQGGSVELLFPWTAISTGLKREYQIYNSGPNTLGLYQSQVTCIAYSGSGCSTTQTSAVGTITLVGTSQQ